MSFSESDVKAAIREMETLGLWGRARELRNRFAIK